MSVVHVGNTHKKTTYHIVVQWLLHACDSACSWGCMHAACVGAVEAQQLHAFRIPAVVLLTALLTVCCDAYLLFAEGFGFLACADRLAQLRLPALCYVLGHAVLLFCIMAWQHQLHALRVLPGDTCYALFTTQQARQKRAVARGCFGAWQRGRILRHLPFLRERFDQRLATQVGWCQHNAWEHRPA